MQLISEATASLAVILRLIAVVLVIIVILTQLEQFQVNRLLRMKGLLLALTTVLLLTNCLPIWYYTYYANSGLPSQSLSEALVINNTLGVLIPAIILYVVYKQKGE